MTKSGDISAAGQGLTIRRRTQTAQRGLRKNELTVH